MQNPQTTTGKSGSDFGAAKDDLKSAKDDLSAGMKEEARSAQQTLNSAKEEVRRKAGEYASEAKTAAFHQAEGAQLETDYYVHYEFLQLVAEYGTRDPLTRFWASFQPVSAGSTAAASPASRPSPARPSRTPPRDSRCRRRPRPAPCPRTRLHVLPAPQRSPRIFG